MFTVQVFSLCFWNDKSIYINVAVNTLTKTIWNTDNVYKIWSCSVITRKLLSPGVRDSVRSIHGVLPHPDLHSIWPDRHHLVGQFLAEPQCNTCQSGPRSDHRTHHDHPHVVHERRTTQDLLRQIYRRVLGNLFRHGLRVVAWQVSLKHTGTLFLFCCLIKGGFV